MFDLWRLPHRRVLTVVVASAAILSACGGGDQSAGTTATTATTATPTPAATVTSTEILGAVVTAGDLIGDEIDLAEVDGRPVVAWFWAPWCTICRAEGPTVGDVADTYSDRVVMIGVPGRGSDADVQRFIDDTDTRSMTHVADFGGSIWSDFGVFAQPAFAFITADGDVEVFVGSLGERALVDRIEALIQA
jgi:thiol-disulfide isomerase/thioredoxin